MLRSALNHRKFRRLAETLGLTRFAAVGLAECLWHLTATQAPQGDIGKLSDAEIAEGVFWPKRSAAKLIEALTSSEVSLLDRCKCHRLRVHDWNCHADQSVKKTLSKNRKSFCLCYSPDPRSGTVPEQNRNDSGLPEPEPEPEPVVPPSVVETPRTDADDARVELRKALDVFRAWAKFTGTDQEILDGMQAFHAPTGPVRIDTCANVALLLATAGKVRAFVRPPKPVKRGGAPAWDLGLEPTWTEEEATAWDPRLGPRPEQPAETVPATLPAMTITAAPDRCPECDSTVRLSTEAGEKVVRCLDDQRFGCAWAAVWREAAA